MAVYVTDPYLEAELRRRRAESGADRFDEVWDGVTMMTPLADNEHQELASGLMMVFGPAI
jgi:hypothetical protein